jgi:hypothetical protein
MTDLLEVIRTAMASDATAEARAAGVHACRTLLAALEPTPGEPATAKLGSPSPVAAMAAALRGVPADQLFDVAITKLQSMLPADVVLPPVTPLKFHMVPMPRARVTP